MNKMMDSQRDSIICLQVASRIQSTLFSKSQSDEEKKEKEKNRRRKIGENIKKRFSVKGGGGILLPLLPLSLVLNVLLVSLCIQADACWHTKLFYLLVRFIKLYFICQKNTMAAAHRMSDTKFHCMI